MHLDKATELMGILIENAARILRAGFGVDQAESSFFSVLDLLQSEPSLKAHFLDEVQATLAQRDPGRLETGMVPPELIELAAHVLRWKELRDLSRSRIAAFFHGDASLAAGDIAVSIDSAFCDDWEDREFYTRFSREPGARPGNVPKEVAQAHV